MANNVFTHYKELHETVMGGDLDDLDAPVKIAITVSQGDEREFTVTGSELVTNEDDGSQVLWLSVVEE